VINLMSAVFIILDKASSAGDSIQVFVRVRPPACNLDTNVCLSVTSPTTLLLRSVPTPKEFTFDHVVDKNTTQVRRKLHMEAVFWLRRFGRLSRNRVKVAVTVFTSLPFWTL